MKNAIFVSFLIFAFSFGSMTAQEYSKRNRLVSDAYLLDEYIKRQDRGISYKDTKTYKGTPYNNPSFLNGNVYQGEEIIASNLAIRYNAMADEMEIKESLDSNDDDARVLTKSPDIFVKIANDIFVFAPYKGGVEEGGYFQVMFEGQKIDLFKKVAKKFTAAKKASTSITRDIPAKFDDRPIYFIVDKNGKFYELPSSKNKKYNVFGSNKKLAKEYAADNRLDINKEKDLKKLVMYYDTLD